MVVWHLLYVMIPFALAVPLACARLVPLRRLFAAPVILALLVDLWDRNFRCAGTNHRS
jgi:hypothetical protein